MSTHNIRFYEDLTNLSFNYHQISSNMHLISSSVTLLYTFFRLNFDIHVFRMSK